MYKDIKVEKEVEKEVVLMLIFNVGVGELPQNKIKDYINGTSTHITNALNPKVNGIELVFVPTPGVFGITVEVIPIKALLEGKFVTKESISMPEMEDVMGFLTKCEANKEVTSSVSTVRGSS